MIADGKGVVSLQSLKKFVQEACMHTFFKAHAANSLSFDVQRS